ncbi:MAG TPA: SAM-dependent methyltransferase [Dongiaceae bacterium]|nr:SAM-dependent methyltransferase [Dongiaceae bacterium]
MTEQGSAEPGKAAVERDPRITADGLIDLRLHHPLTKGQNLLCPYDHLFWNEAGRDLATLAQAVDPSYAAFNIARYRWFTERLHRAAKEVPQILILGAGFDSRAMALPPLREGMPDIYEVDFPDKIAAKLDVFARHQVPLPPHLHHVGADLADPLLRAKLSAAGYRRELPTVVLMEGVFFFLARAAAAALLEPRVLGLAPGSRMVFDVWTQRRQDDLNEKVEARLGRRLFGESPMGDSMEEIALYAESHGYGDIEVISLDRLCAAYGIPAERDPLPQSWLIVEAGLPQA